MAAEAKVESIELGWKNMANSWELVEMRAVVRPFSFCPAHEDQNSRRSSFIQVDRDQGTLIVPLCHKVIQLLLAYI